MKPATAYLAVGIQQTMPSKNFVPILYRRPGKVGILALLAERKFNNLRGINTPLEFDSVPGHHNFYFCRFAPNRSTCYSTPDGNMLLRRSRSARARPLTPPRETRAVAGTPASPLLFCCAQGEREASAAMRERSARGDSPLKKSPQP